MRADRLLLSRLAPAKPSSELHGCRARTSSSGLVSLPSTRSSSVSSSVTLSLVTTSTGSSRSSWPGLSPQHQELFCKQLCHPLPCHHQHGEQQKLLAKHPGRQGQELLLLPVLVVTRERVTELLTEELLVLGRLTRPELLVLALHPWSSEEGLAGASLLSNYLSALIILRSE